jgi:hypothetical protein
MRERDMKHIVFKHQRENKTPASSTNKTAIQDKTEILLKVALNTIA